jgi:hypothetical protein
MVESERMNGDKLPKYLVKKSEFSMFAAKAKAYLAMKFLGPTLYWVRVGHMLARG